MAIKGVGQEKGQTVYSSSASNADGILGRKQRPSVDSDSAMESWCDV